MRKTTAPSAPAAAARPNPGDWVGAGTVVAAVVTAVVTAVVGTVVGLLWLETENSCDAVAPVLMPVTVTSYCDECSGLTEKLQ